MRQFFAVWSWKLPDGRPQEITMTFWAHDAHRARQIAHQWWGRVEATMAPADFTIADLTAEKGQYVR